MSHTPGPWKWFDYPDGRKLLAADWAAVIHCADAPMSCESSDASLIAAAPELYEAAQLALTVIDFCLPYITNESDRRVVAEQALRAAIAKAEGR